VLITLVERATLASYCAALCFHRLSLVMAATPSKVTLYGPGLLSALKHVLPNSPALRLASQAFGERFWWVRIGIIRTLYRGIQAQPILLKIFMRWAQRAAVSRGATCALLALVLLSANGNRSIIGLGLSKQFRFLGNSFSQPDYRNCISNNGLWHPLPE
jgi:hypothetical protein